MTPRWPSRVIALAMVAVAGGAVALSHVAGARSAHRLFRESRQAASELSFTADATVGALVGGRWIEQPVHIQHAAGRMRMTVGEGPKAQVLLGDGRCLCEATNGIATPVGEAPAPEASDLSLLDGNYDVQPIGVRTIAGRAAHGIALRSRHLGHEARRLWVDPETKIVVAEEGLSCDGLLLTRTVFGHLYLGPSAARGDRDLPECRSAAPIDAAQPVTDDECRESCGFAPRLPAHVPPGYIQSGLYVRQCRGGRKFAEVRYTDGLTTLSVFENMRRGRGFRYGGGRGGGGGGWGWQQALIPQGAAKVVRERRADLDVLVAGDLPQQLLSQVLSSVP